MTDQAAIDIQIAKTHALGTMGLLEVHLIAE